MRLPATVRPCRLFQGGFSAAPKAGRSRRRDRNTRYRVHKGFVRDKAVSRTLRAGKKPAPLLRYLRLFSNTCKIILSTKNTRPPCANCAVPSLHRICAALKSASNPHCRKKRTKSSAITGAKVSLSARKKRCGGKDCRAAIPRGNLTSFRALFVFNNVIMYLLFLDPSR